jgi:hypothetical protein
VSSLPTSPRCWSSSRPATAPPSGHPEAGWDTLKEQLISDLTYQGRVLPIQARVVFRGLIDLPYVGISAYERAGGVDGLEAGYVEDAVGAAARAAGTSAQRALSALDLLQAPMTFGETREHLLRCCSRVAGLLEDTGFETTDDFVAWAREHRPDLDLSRRPRMPAGLLR